MEPGRLIFLNGSSSAGKTSACRHFQEISPEEFVCLGIDLFWLSIPPKQCALHTAEPKYLVPNTYLKEEKPYLHITPGPHLDAVIYASYKAIASYLSAGINVISDQLFWKPEWFHEALKEFNPYHVFYVGLRVSDEEGQRREKHRSKGVANDVVGGGRPDGWNRCSAEVTHQGMIYDLEIDNTFMNIEETAKKILEGYNNCSEPMAFKQQLISFSKIKK